MPQIIRVRPLGHKVSFNPLRVLGGGFFFSVRCFKGLQIGFKQIISKHGIFLGMLITPLSMKMIISSLLVDWFFLVGNFMGYLGGCPGRPPFARW